MELQKFNLHTHTYRCGHAVGDEYDYIKQAITNGFEVLGFSEHCGYHDFDDPGERITFTKMDEYKEDIEKAKLKYKHEIKIYNGLEIEYFDDMVDYYEELKQKHDYLIIGQHAKDRLGYYYHNQCTDKDVRYMAYQVCSALEKNISKYVAHIDYFMIGRQEYSSECEVAVREILKTAKKCGAAIEINLKGARFTANKRIYNGNPTHTYPHIRTIEILKEEKADIVFGYDAHDPIVFEDRSYESNMKELLGEDVNYITDLKRIIGK